MIAVGILWLLAAWIFLAFVGTVAWSELARYWRRQLPPQDVRELEARARFISVFPPEADR